MSGSFIAEGAAVAFYDDLLNTTWRRAIWRDGLRALQLPLLRVEIVVVQRDFEQSVASVAARAARGSSETRWDNSAAPAWDPARGRAGGWHYESKVLVRSACGPWNEFSVVPLCRPSTS